MEEQTGVHTHTHTHTHALLAVLWRYISSLVNPRKQMNEWKTAWG